MPGRWPSAFDLYRSGRIWTPLASLQALGLVLFLTEQYLGGWELSLRV